MEIAGYTAPDKYISTRCWLGEHEECRRHPIVRCACLCHEAEALGLDPEPCIECGESADRPLVTSHRMVPAGDGHWKPAPPVPLCERHHLAVSSGELPLPAWCSDCDAWRVTRHHH